MEQVGQALLRLGAATKDKSKQEKNEEGDTQTHTHPLSLSFFDQFTQESLR